MDVFDCRTKIVSGSGAVRYLERLGARRLFLVTDPYFAQNGTAAKLQQLSGAEQVVLFDKVTPDPTVEQVAEMVGMTPGGMYRLLEGKMHVLSDGMKYRICLALDIAPRVMEEGMKR